MKKPSQIQFAPFIAINQFMLPEYRQEVIEYVLKQISSLSINRRSAINHLFQRYVKIPGFRKSDLAPLPIKIRQSQSAFEQHSDFAAQILAAWSELKPALCQQIFDLLTTRGWEILPVEADRTKIPGFLVLWRKEETYDKLGKAYHLMFPEVDASENDIRLMVVWLSGRLPFDMDDNEDSDS